MNRRHFAGAALAAILGLVWAGCGTTGQQPTAAMGDGGTNMAMMAEGAPGVSGTMPGAATPLPQESFEYVVQTGDSLWKIANKFGTSVSLIQRMNNMPADQITIRVGDKLRIPGKADTERLRQESSALPPATVPTVTIPSAPATYSPMPTPAASTPTPAASASTPAAPKSSSVYTSPGGTSWLPQSYRNAQSGAPATPSATLSVTPPATTTPAATLSVTPPATTTPSATLSVKPSTGTTTPTVTLSPGSTLLSPSAVPPASGSPAPSLQLTPTTDAAPAAGGAPASIGMTFQAVGPENASPPAPAATPAPKP